MLRFTFLRQKHYGRRAEQVSISRWRTAIGEPVKCQMLRSDPKFELFEDLEEAGEIVGPEGNTDSIGVGGIGASTDDREFEDVGIAG